MDDRISGRRIDRRRFLAALGAGGSLLSVPALLEACGGGTSGGTGEPGQGSGKVPFYDGTFTVAMITNPQGLDPQLNTNTESYQAMMAIYDPLVGFSPSTGEYYPRLIQKMPDTSDPTSYTMKLRPDIKFHDGSPLTTADVKATFDFILRTGKKSPSYTLFASLAEVKVVDDLTFQMNLSAPSSSFVAYLAGMQGAIVKKAAREGGQDLTRDPKGAGSGPFELVDWVDGDHLTFQRFKDYFREGHPKFEKLTYRIVLDPSARETQVLSGSVDFAYDTPKKDYQKIITTSGVHGKAGPAQKVDVVYFNQAHPMGKDLHLRRALNFAVDGNALLKAVYAGQGAVAHGPLRPGSKWYDPAVEKISFFDLDKAKAELKQSTQPRGLTFDFPCQNDPVIVQQATLIQAMWRKIGVKANVLPMEKVSFLNRIKLGDPGWFVGCTTWADGVYTPDYMINTNFTRNGSFGRTGWWTPQVDDLITQVEQTADLARQRQLMSQVSKIMAEQVPAIWFTWQVWTPAWRDYVRGYAPANTYYAYLDEVAIASHS
jgi:peptide/nickel transport system substrate-binding protein